MKARIFENIASFEEEVSNASDHVYSYYKEKNKQFPELFQVEELPTIPSRKSGNS